MGTMSKRREVGREEEVVGKGEVVGNRRPGGGLRT